MPITRKQQILTKRETTEGGGATFAGSDAIQVYDPSISDSVDQLDRSPAGPTLSRDFTPVGRKQRELTFTSDFRGSGTATTLPDWGPLLEASGYKPDNADEQIQTVTLTGDPTASFQLGEQITQSAGTISAVIVGCFNASDVPQTTAAASSDYMVVVELIGSLVTDAATVGVGSGATSSLLTIADTSVHHSYMPTSAKLIQITDSGNWSSNPVVGDTLRIERAGVLVGSGQVIAVTATTADIVLLTGSVASGDVIKTGATTNGTLDADTVMTRTPSLAFRHNLDGRNRVLNGARATFSLAGEVGQPMAFTWTFQGDVGTDADAAAVTTSNLGSTRAPRLLGAICAYGTGTDIRTLQTKSVSFDNGGTVAPNLDANSAGGSTGANITDRDSALSVTVDNTLGTVDWEALRDAGTAVRVGFVLGSTAGNIVSFVMPNCQVTEVSIGDSDGVSTMDLTLRPRRLAESGDDEIFLSQL
mgnify:CR=1 FL=1